MIAFVENTYIQGGYMRSIPNKVKENLKKDPFMKVCAYPGCGNQLVQWHHTYIYARKQIVEDWATVPCCENHHKLVDTNKRVKDFFKWVSLYRGELLQIVCRYPKFQWAHEWQRVNDQFEYKTNKQLIEYFMEEDDHV